MPFKKIYLVSAAIACGSLFGVVKETVDGSQPLSVTFSTSSHNRIAVEDGAVEKVFGDSSIFSVTVDPITGNAFVNVMEEIGGDPATLSVVTSTGLVQDLLVSSREGTSEQVLLRENEENRGFGHEMSLASSVDVLNKILEGKVPFGYGKREAAEPLVLPAPLTAESMSAFEGPFEIISVYRIANGGSEPVVLSADALKKENGSWVFLDIQELGQDEEAICLVGRPKDEGGL
jgi:TraK protein